MLSKQQPFSYLQPVIVLLMVSVVFLLPFGRLSEVPISILAVIGLYTLLNQWKNLSLQSWFKPFSCLYLAYFSLIAISAIDSYWFDKSWLIALASIRFYLMGLALLYFASPKSLSNIIMVTTLLAVFWMFDAGIQSLFGQNLFGQESYPGRLTGVFGHNVKLGPVLALFLPLVLIQLNSVNVWLRWAVTALILVSILLSGTRSAWLMMIFVMFLYWLHHSKERRWLLLLKTSTLVLVASVTLWFTSDAFKQRIDRTLNLFQGDVAAIDYALADRIPIWNTALNMYAEHPINGVGARAFRVVYKEYAGVGDVWVANEGTGLHAHHWVLELLAETGTIGFFLMLFLIVILFQHVRLSFRSNHVWPFATALLAAMLPVVSLYSLFSSFWSICLWWVLMMLFLGVKHGKN